MPFSYAQYTGNGSTTTFSVTFPYLLKAHVKLYTGYSPSTGEYDDELLLGTDYAWISDTQVQTTLAPAIDLVLTIKRETPSGSQLVNWSDGSNLVADDLDTSDKQGLFAVQELSDLATAVSESQAQASADASEAIAAVGSVLPYSPIPSVASIPASPTNGARVEIADTTGIETFSPLSGRPVGFVGSNQLRARLTFTTTGNTWNWVDYSAPDPDGRYIRLTSISTSTTSTSTTTVAASSAVRTVQLAATAAQSSANTAQTTANIAQFAANNANTTANTAVTNAATAQTTANSAVTNAATAQATANTAVTNAATAQTTANTAVTNAATAQATANAALPLAGGTMTGPLVLDSGEYTFGRESGLVESFQYYRLDAEAVHENVTTDQSLFGVGVTLAASTVYEFESVFLLRRPSAAFVGHTISLLFGGTATLNNISYALLGNYSSSAANAVVAPDNFAFSEAATALVVNTAATAATSILVFKCHLKGTLSVNAGGTFVPQFKLSAAPGATTVYRTVAGSFFKIGAIGAAGANTAVGSWA